MKGTARAIFLVLLISLFNVVNSFDLDPLFLSKAKQKIRRASGGVAIENARLNMSSQQADTTSTPESDVNLKQNHVSLASDYRVDICSSQHGEAWSFAPIANIIHETSLPVGAQAYRALQAESVETDPNSAIKSSRNGDAIDVTVDSRQDSSLDPKLVATLSRIMVQRLASLQQDADTVNVYSVALPNEESILVKSLSEQSTVLKLFEPLLDTSDVELVEMVDRSGTPLGMVPRPLVHTFNLLHRGIGMVVAKDASIVNSRSEVFPDLYVHRRTDDKRIFPSLYDMFVGGVSSAGEEATRTAAREVAEELGISRALVDPMELSAPLFDCTVCTAYNRCVVSVFCFQFDSSRDSIAWQPEEVAWGSFVPYNVIEESARLCVERMKEAGSWPGEEPFALTLANQDSRSVHEYEENNDWTTWEYVPDGLLVWEAWLKWQSGQKP